MNNYFRYQQDYNEFMGEDSEGMQEFLAKEREETLNSYAEGEEVVYCSICGEPLKKGSMSYYEGMHIDSCV